MNLIDIYEDYKTRVDTLEAAGATFLCLTSSDTTKDINDLQSHIRKDIREVIKNDTTFEEDINETDKVIKSKVS